MSGSGNAYIFQNLDNHDNTNDDEINDTCYIFRKKIKYNNAFVGFDTENEILKIGIQYI